MGSTVAMNSHNCFQSFAFKFLPHPSLFRGAVSKDQLSVFGLRKSSAHPAVEFSSRCAFVCGPRGAHSVPRVSSLASCWGAGNTLPIFFSFPFFLSACGILVLWPGIETGQQWKRGVLTTGPPGNYQISYLCSTTYSSCDFTSWSFQS